MQELVFTGSKTLRWREAPEPKLLVETDALVRPFLAAHLKVWPNDGCEAARGVRL
jgi:hypothetical protein